MKQFDSYEIAGVIAPGVVVLVAAGLIWPEYLGNIRRLDITVGGLGLALLLAYVAGHLLQAIGNLLEMVWWKIRGGWPSDWPRTGKGNLLANAQMAKLQERIRVDLGYADLRIDSALPAQSWLPIFSQIYAIIRAAGKDGRAHTFNGNYGMRDHPTDPIAYLQNLGIGQVFRFILTHPDMDHMDGFKALCDEIGILNFWDSGARKAKPDFSGGPYREADWDHYVKVRDRQAGVTVVRPRAGSRFQYANQGEPDNRGDCLAILAPNPDLIRGANQTDEPNDASYVIVYRTVGGRIVFCGDAHDETWEYVLANYESDVKNCAVLIAPHHGRSSGRAYDFLDVLNPKLTLFGCADSEHLAYDAWNRRKLLHITNNQAGNVILDASADGINVYVENVEFGCTFPTFDIATTLHECYFIGRVANPQPQPLRVTT